MRSAFGFLPLTHTKTERSPEDQEWKLMFDELCKLEGLAQLNNLPPIWPKIDVDPISVALEEYESIAVEKQPSIWRAVT